MVGEIVAHRGSHDTVVWSWRTGFPGSLSLSGKSGSSFSMFPDGLSPSRGLDSWVVHFRVSSSLLHSL